MAFPLVGSSLMCQAVFLLLLCVAPCQGKIRAHYLHSNLLMPLCICKNICTPPSRSRCRRIMPCVCGDITTHARHDPSAPLTAFSARKGHNSPAFFPHTAFSASSLPGFAKLTRASGDGLSPPPFARTAGNTHMQKYFLREPRLQVIGGKGGGLRMSMGSMVRLCASEVCVDASFMT